MNKKCFFFFTVVKEIVLRQLDGDSGLSDLDTKHQFEICTDDSQCCRTTPVNYTTAEGAHTKTLSLESDGLGCHDFCFDVSFFFAGGGVYCVIDERMVQFNP